MTKEKSLHYKEGLKGKKPDRKAIKPPEKIIIPLWSSTPEETWGRIQKDMVEQVKTEPLTHEELLFFQGLVELRFKKREHALDSNLYDTRVNELYAKNDNLFGEESFRTKLIFITKHLPL